MAGLQGGSASGKNNIFGERRAIFDTESKVRADGAMNRGLKQNVFQRRGALEAKKINIGETFQLGREIKIRASTGEKYSRIYEIGLAFFFAGPHGGQETAGRGEEYAGAGEADAFAIPKTEKSSSKIREFNDGIEAASASITGMGVAGGVKGSEAITDPVVVQGNFRGGHLRVDGYRAARDGIEGVFAYRLVEGMGEIKASYMAATEPTKIAGADTVENRANALRDNASDGRGANQKSVVVVVKTGIVFIEGENKFRGVARRKEVLQVGIGEKHLLVAAVKCGVEAAVGIFFEEIEIGKIVFEAIALEIAEDTETGLLIDKKKTAEVGVELLNAGARGYEIEIRAEVGEFYLDKSLLQGKVLVEAIGSAANVGADDAKFAYAEIIQTNFRGDADAPVGGFEGSIAVEEVKGETESLIEEGLLALAKKIITAGARSADVAGGRDTSSVDKRFGGSSEVQKNLLTEFRGP